MAKQEELPKESYVRQAEQPFSSSEYVFKLNQMISFYDVPGELGHAMEGAQYRFESLSFIITETQPGGGPPFMSMSAKKHTCCWKVKPLSARRSKVHCRRAVCRKGPRGRSAYIC